MLDRAHYLPPQAVINDIRAVIGRFEPDPYRQMGHTDSSHGVLFGQSEVLGDVAVKPFVTRPKKAWEEAIALDGLRERGFVALEPLEVATGGLATYLITKDRRGLNHLGEVDWDADVANPALRRVVIPTLQSVTDLLGTLTERGVVHGDFRAKNAAFDKSGEPVIIDAENTRLDLPPVGVAHGTDRDLARFGKSILSRGLLGKRTAEYRVNFLKDHLVEPVLEVSSATGQDPAIPSLDERREKLITELHAVAAKNPTRLRRSTRPKAA